MIGIFIFSLLCNVLNAENSFLAKTLGSNMVLQRNVNAAVYGYASIASSKITAVFDDKSYDAVASASVSNDGGYFWKISLDPTGGGFTPYSINITSSSGELANLDNVLFGDVYLCGGQSNMQFSISGEFDASKEILQAEYYPNIRLFSVGSDSTIPDGSEPLDDLYSVQEPWVVASKEMISDGQTWGYFSAVCWEFGKNLYWGALGGEVPIGLISDNWGGTPVEAWAPQSVVDACRVVAASDAPVVNHDKPMEVDQYSTRKDPTLKTFYPFEDAALYNTMIAPYRDMLMTGVLWYQGESNVGSSTYGCMQDGMVTAWRDLMHNPNLGFLYTQLSTWTAGGMGYVPSFRSDQTVRCL